MNRYVCMKCQIYLMINTILSPCQICRKYYKYMNISNTVTLYMDTTVSFTQNTNRIETMTKEKIERSENKQKRTIQMKVKKWVSLRNERDWTTFIVAGSTIPFLIWIWGKNLRFYLPGDQFDFIFISFSFTLFLAGWLRLWWSVSGLIKVHID